MVQVVPVPGSELDRRCVRAGARQQRGSKRDGWRARLHTVAPRSRLYRIAGPRPMKRITDRSGWVSVRQSVVYRFDGAESQAGCGFAGYYGLGWRRRAMVWKWRISAKN
jgi:hypothetical protein